MNREDYYELGYIAKPVGLNGELAVILDVDDVEEYEDLESIFIEVNGDLVPYLVEEVKFKGNKVSLILEDINSIEKAEKLRGKKLYLPVEELPDLDEGSYYLHELIGYQVFDYIKGYIGNVKLIYNLPTQDLLAVEVQGTEVMIPTHEDIMVEVKQEERRINVQLPEGLLEIYLNK
ncbi:ribosome maturation factor RimM [Thermoflexibacter ruber]|uniref:Ribosome maturation factor RimM n=1 Tax=Thermoflexibacter ruber TaxID=1003 RepID=A0A1I2BTG6_9BACT|nr:ribosome maturation factor RimM [Thermoflexibacter ruber]SFE59382.1 16S rRNA processing protein RimM [Thermoflexibacter ruber]